MIENEDSHVECPVCHKKFESEFALKGHLRLMKDEAHVAFREASHTKEENTIVPASLSTPFVGTKLIDRLATIVEDQEKIYGKQIKDDAFLGKLKNMITQERENDTNQQEEDFQAGCDHMTKEYEECLIPNRLVQMKEKLRAALTPEIEAKYENKLNETKNGHERDIGLLLRDIKNKDIYIECPYCSSNVKVEKNGQIHFEIVAIMRRARLGHLDCVRKYAPQLAYYWDTQYQVYRRSLII